MKTVNEAKDVGVIVVTYNPNMEDFKKNIKRIIDLHYSILIIDNGSNKQLKDFLGQISTNTNLNVVFLQKNRGIGCAQNVGINYFMQKNVNYLLFMDQDSFIDRENLLKLKNILEELRAKDKKCIAVGPAQENEFLENNVEETSWLISSGSLIAKETFKKIGNFKEEFFIDYIDYEWIWRAKKLGYKVYKTRLAHMQHETMGVQRKYGHTIDPEFRLYYIFRNSIYLTLYEKIDWKIKENLVIKNSGKLLFQVLLPNRKSRLKTCWYGIRDGIRKKLN